MSQEAVSGNPRGAWPCRARKWMPEPIPMGARNWTILPIRAHSSERRKRAAGAVQAASSILSTLARWGVWVWLCRWPSPRERTKTKEECAGFEPKLLQGTLMHTVKNVVRACCVRVCAPCCQCCDCVCPAVDCSPNEAPLGRCARCGQPCQSVVNDGVAGGGCDSSCAVAEANGGGIVASNDGS